MVNVSLNEFMGFKKLNYKLKAVVLWKSSIKIINILKFLNHSNVIFSLIVLSWNWTCKKILARLRKFCDKLLIWIVLYN